MYSLRGKSNPLLEHITIYPETLNDFYCSTAVKLTSFLVPTSNPMDYLNNVNMPNSFHIEDTNLLELKEISPEVEKKNSTGIDKISVKILNKLPDSALITLLMAINKSFAFGKFPPCLKTALAMPLFKGGNSEDPSNL